MPWEVHLTSDPTDLRMLADVFTGGEVQVVQCGEEYVLRSSQFELLDSAASVHQCAIEVVTSLSGSARLVLGAREAIAVGAVYRTHQDGRRDTAIVVGTGDLRMRGLTGTSVQTYSDGTTRTRRPGDPITKWLPLATQNQAVAKALRLRDAKEGLDWCDLHRLYEVIEHDVGRLIHQLRWASHNELERFTRTSNSVAGAGDMARHGVERTHPPPNPLPLSGARELIDRIMEAWLSWKAGQHNEGSAT